MPTKTTEDRPETRGRSTLYKGIRMRSRTEADYAAYLDRRGRQWEYEPDCFADETGQWLPDFRVRLDAEDVRLLEVKPAQLLVPTSGECQFCVVRRVDVIIDKARIAWSTEPAAAIEIVFWRYGAAAPDLSLIGVRGCGESRLRGYWAARMPNFAFPFTWPGQGQEQELMTHPGMAAADSHDEAQSTSPSVKG